MFKTMLQIGILFASLALGAEGRAMVRLCGRCEAAGSAIVHWDLNVDGRQERGPRRDFRVPHGRRLVVTQAAFTLRGGRTALKRGGHFVLFQVDGNGRSDLAEVSGVFHPELPASTVLRRFIPGLALPAGAVPGVSWQIAPREESVLSVTLYGWLVPDSAPAGTAHGQ